jgi:glutathione S-transferase
MHIRCKGIDLSRLPAMLLCLSQDTYLTHCPAQVPFLEDPNTGLAMFESKAIIEYLEKTYGSTASV